MSPKDRTATAGTDDDGNRALVANVSDRVAAAIEISAFDNRWNVAAVRMAVENEKLPSLRETASVVLPLKGRHLEMQDTLSTMQWNRLALERQQQKSL